MAIDTWTLISNRITEMSELNTRQDATKSLVYWDDEENQYKFLDPDKKELAQAISVTPNLPKTFAHSVISDLQGGKWQAVVEGEGVTSRQAHYIESFIEDNFAQADEFLLAKYGIPTLHGRLCSQVCLRWAIGVRWIASINKEGEYEIDCLPVDMRWTPCVLGKWVAPIFKRNKDELEQELEAWKKRAKDENIGEYFDTSLPESGKVELRDYFDTKWHELWVAQKLVYREPNTLGYPPFAIAIPSSGFGLNDEGSLKHEGEDILFLNAGLYKEFARSLSMEQTSGYAALYPAYEREVANADDSKPSMPVPDISTSKDVNKGERHVPVPRGDINRAGQTARADIRAQIEAGAPLSPRQYNTAPSAVLLAGETELISRLQNARKEALGVLRSQLARMIVKQAITLGKGKTGLFIGKEGKRSTYSLSKLGDPKRYTISYQLTVKSKRQELANLAEFLATTGKLPLKWTLTNILMADDPDGIERDLEIEQAKRADPAIGLAEMGMRYAEEAEEMDDGVDKELKNFQSMLLIERSVALIKQRMQPAPVSQEVREPKVEQPKGGGQLLASVAGQAMKGEAVGKPVTTSEQPREGVTQ